MDVLLSNTSLNEFFMLLSLKSLKSMMQTTAAKDLHSYIHSNTSMCNFGDFISYETIPYIMAPISVVITLLTFFTRLNCKIIFPYNMLNYYKRKYLVCVIFVAYANMLLSAWVESDFERSLPILQSLPNLRRALFKILLMFVYGTAAYPLLAALSHPFIVLLVLTTLYSWLFFGLHIFHYYRVVQCKRECSDSGYNIRDYFVPIPSMLSFGILSVAYILLLIEAVHPRFRNRSYSSHISPKDYVRQLFKDKEILQESRMANRNMPITKRLRNYWRRWKHRSFAGVRYPPILLASMCCSATITYELAVVCLHHLVNHKRTLMNSLVSIPNDEDVKKIIRYFADVISSMNADNVANLFIDNDMKDNLKSLFQYAGYRQVVCAIFALTMASLYAIVTVVWMPFTFRSDLKQSFKEYSCTPNKISRVSGANNVVLGFVFFTGFQTAFLCAGFLLHYWLFLFISMGVEFGMVIPLKFGYGDYIINFTKNILPAFIITVITAVLQHILAYYVFTDRGQTLAVRHRKLLFLFGHYLFFYNFILGIFALVWRILQSLVVFLLLIPRMDQTVLPAFIKKLDRPYHYYMHYLYMINLHSNPVLLGFIQCLQSTQKKRISATQSSNEKNTNDIGLSLLAEKSDDKMNEAKERSRKRAIINWKIAYTLHWNPVLQFYRKHAIDDQAEKLQRFIDAQKREDEMKSQKKVAFNRLESRISNATIF